MARCSLCKKFSLFKSFKNGICPLCEKKLLKEKEEREFQEYQERRRHEIQEENRLSEEKAERERIEQMLTLPPRFWGCNLAYQYNDVNLFVPSPDAFDNMNIGTELYAFAEPANVHDAHAVRLAHRGLTLAYFYRGNLQDMANDYIKFGGRIYGIVSSLSPDSKTITAHLGFYKSENQDEFKSLYTRHPKAKLFRLTGNSSETRQANIMVSNVGDKCDIEYDYSKEKYLVVSTDELGYLPASAARLVDELGEIGCSVYVGSIDSIDSGKFIISVYIFPID